MEVEENKKKMIDEVKSIDRSKLFSPPPKEKTTLIKKLVKIFGFKK